MTVGKSENGKWKIENRMLNGELGGAAEGEKITPRRRARGVRRKTQRGHDIWYPMLGSVTIGTREIQNPSLLLALRVGFVGDGGEGAEQEIANVGEDGGAAGGDAVLRK